MSHIRTGVEYLRANIAANQALPVEVKNEALFLCNRLHAYDSMLGWRSQSEWKSFKKRQRRRNERHKMGEELRQREAAWDEYQEQRYRDAYGWDDSDELPYDHFYELNAGEFFLMTGLGLDGYSTDSEDHRHAYQDDSELFRREYDMGYYDDDSSFDTYCPHCGRG